jgi:hypothetical protein
MRWRDWFRRALHRRRPGETVKTVPFRDAGSGRIVRIPASELSPGAILGKDVRTGKLAWLNADDVQPGEIRHPPFGESVRQYIREIQAALAEPRPLTFEEWEDGFRRDADALYEIALWLHAAKVYRDATAGETSPERRLDVYRVIVSCLAASPGTVWLILKTQVLTRQEADRVIQRIYGKKAYPI